MSNVATVSQEVTHLTTYQPVLYGTLVGMPRGTAQDQGDIERRVLAALSERVTNVTRAAAYVGVSASQLGRYLSGARPIRLTEFVLLCDYLGVNPAELLRAAEEDGIPGGEGDPAAG